MCENVTTVRGVLFNVVYPVSYGTSPYFVHINVL